MRPELALVPGEPAGIGPELCVRLVQQPREDCRLLAFADPDTLRAAAAALNLPLQLLPEDAEARVPGDLRVRVVANTVPSHFGQANPANAGAVIGALLGAGQACLSGELHGVVTGPVHKAVINEGGIAYSGTTELLADQAGVKPLPTCHCARWPTRSPRPAWNTPCAPCMPPCVASSACLRRASPCSA